MSTTTSKAGLMPALLAVQQELPKLQRDAINPHFRNRYISLDSLMAAIRPVLLKNGLLWITKPCRDDQGEPALSYRLVRAESGESEDGMMPLMMAKSDPQGQGSAITYARRYSITAMLGLVADEDDDGHGATQGARQQRTNGTAPTPVDAIHSQAAEELAAMIPETGWSREDAQMQLTAVGAQDTSNVKAAISRLSASQAQAFRQAVNAAIDARAAA